MRLLLLLFLSVLTPLALAVNCDLPCGASELISCAAQKNNLSPQDFFYQRLFHPVNIDGFCRRPADSNLRTGQQKLFYNKFCRSGAEQYLGYEDFISAAEYFLAFACQGDRDSRYKELAAFLSTVAEETTSRLNNFTNDGLYYRYENSALKGSSWANRSSYFPNNSYQVAIDDHGQLYSQTLWYGRSSGANTMNLATTPEQLSWGKIVVPNGYQLVSLNKVVLPGYWVGMGPIQLTGGSLIEFFGWYSNNIVESAASSYDVNEYVEQYMQDGEMAFIGAFWYWMVRVGGNNYATLHEVVTNHNKAVCHDIGAVTRIVNGGCHGFNPGRMNYYKYFSNLFHVDIKPVSVTISSHGRHLRLNSMECSEEIRRYC